jgi:YD repeat-containing protein
LRREDDLGRQKSITDANGTTDFYYDFKSRVIKVNSPQGTINYTYDLETGQKTSVSATSTVTSYTYDLLGRLKTVTDTDGGITTYNYTEVGSRESITLPNNTITQYSYNNLNRLTQIVNKNSSDAIINSHSYTLAPNGRRTAVTEKRLEPNGSYSTTDINYTFDGMNRLVAENSSSSEPNLNYSNQYSYDLVGNRTNKVCNVGSGSEITTETIDYSYNANDQLTTEDSDVKGVTTYSYDDNGCLLSKTGSAGTYNYTYNLQGRLSTAVIARQENGQTININSSYAYNQSGLRVRAFSTVNGVDNNRIYSGVCPLKS